MLPGTKGIGLKRLFYFKLDLYGLSPRLAEHFLPCPLEQVQNCLQSHLPLRKEELKALSPCLTIP